jgi:hypothetical protein
VGNSIASTALVKSSPRELQEAKRVRLVQDDLDDIRAAIKNRRAAGDQAAFTATLTDRARKLTQTLRETVNGPRSELIPTFSVSRSPLLQRLSSPLLFFTHFHSYG